MEFTALLLAVSFIGFTAADFIKSEGKTRKVFIIVDIILIGIFASFMICGHIYATNIDRDSEKYEIYGLSLFGEIVFEGETEDYYLIEESAFLSTGFSIAVPKNGVEISPLVKKCDNILVYCNKGTELASSKKVPNGSEYFLCENAVKICPDFTSDFIIIKFFNLLILYSFNALIFVIVLVQRKKETV